MEWREQTSVSCEDAFDEAQRWMEEVTNKSFGSDNFRSALENGVLLCELINQLKPGVIKRMNRLSTPIAGLDNINVFLRACGELGLNEAQLFHPGDLQDLSTRATLRGSESNRRLKNVLITIYWLGRKAQGDCFYSGPQLNLKAFEGLLGIALSKALEEAPRAGSVRDSGYSELWYPEREEGFPTQQKRQSQPPSYRREDSVESFDSAGSFDSLGSRTLSCISDSSCISNSTLRAASDGCSSDMEAESCFRMAEGRDSGQANQGLAPAGRCRRRQEEDRTKGSPPSHLTRNREVNPGWIWSKSMNDITPRMSAVLGSDPAGQDPLQKGRARVMDSEAKWHNDLTQWKLRRRMSNSDLRRKMQQKDNIGLMANAKVVTVGTFRSLQQDGGQDSPGSRSYKVVTSTKTVSPSIKTACSSASTIAKEGSLELRPQTRGLLTRSYAVESCYSSEDGGPSSTGALQDPEPLVGGDKSPMTGPPSDGATSQFVSLTQSHGRSISSPSLMVSTGQNQNAKTLTNGSGSFPVDGIGTSRGSDTTSSFGSDAGSHRTSASMDGSVNQKSVLGPESGRFSSGQSQQQCPQPGAQQQECHFYRYSSRAPGSRGPGGVSASLPRGYRRADSSSSCLSAGFTPRPFGAKLSRVSSLPGLCHSFLPEDSKFNRKTSPPEVSRPRKQVTISEEAVSAQTWVPANQSSVNQEVKKEGRSQSSILKTRGSDPTTHPSPPASIMQIQKGSSEMHRSDLRVSLSLKPNSRPDFGFIAHWDSTGARIKSVQPGSSAELCQLRVGDEIMSVAGHRVAEMSYDQWKGTMTSALQQGSLTMDVRCNGHHDWASSLHSQAFITRKTINLTGGLPTIVGQPDTDRDTGITTAKTVKLSRAGGQALNGMAVKSLNGGFRDDPEAVRSKGGSVSAISDLQVPSLSTSSSWSWDPEEERRRQQSWQEEQERQLQEKYRRDQERLDAEWQQAQKEAGLVGYSQAEVGLSKGVMENGVAEVSDTACPAGHQPIQSQPSPPAQVVSNQKKEVDWERREGPCVEEVESLSEREETGDFWSGDSYAFTELSAADRLKSKSTSSLVSFHGDKLKGGTSEVPRMKLGQSMSPAEVERQQILGEMRKRTALLTDSSWIRQRAASTSREPVSRSSSMRRYESMDNLHNPAPSSSSSTTAVLNPVRPYSSLGFSASHRPPSSSSRQSMAGAYGGYSSGTQKHSPTWSRPSCTSPTWPNLGVEPLTESQPSSQQRGSGPTTPCRILSSRQACSVCGIPLGRGAAMVIQALGLCFHLACFQCADCRCHLGGYELRTQIRIRNTQPYCDPCYIRHKSHFATPL
ncbi:LIM domain only protein 7b isoform X3 [Esox lucius]|uniref:LIM domain only protein 7b isoform X3 n=1 Tax=Esox lucius TaxID=8010 RepID=UPI001476E896|nr:LIM domain only protein 7b isoform X3 [Esox lucius]